MRIEVQLDSDANYIGVVQLADPSNDWGVKRTYDGTTIIPATTPMEILGGNKFAYEFTDLDGTGPWDYSVKAETADYVSFVSGQVDIVPNQLSSRYCDLVEMYRLFGKDNIKKWCRFGEDTEDDVQARVVGFMLDADEFIDQYLYGGVVEVPFPRGDDLPRIIRTAANTLAGVLCYESRGIDDEGETGKVSPQRQRVMRLLTAIKTGAYTLPGAVPYTPIAGGSDIQTLENRYIDWDAWRLT
jgi:hypothetical protein